MNVRGGITIFCALEVSKNYSSFTSIQTVTNWFLVSADIKFKLFYSTIKDLINWIYLICTFFFFGNLIIPDLWIMGGFSIPFA